MPVTETAKWNRLRGALGVVWLAVVFCLTLEVAARVDDWFHYGAPLLERYDFEQLFRLTDRGIRGIPHGRYMRWRLNRDGLRGPDVPLTLTNGHTRLVVYGASEAFGIYEDDGKEFPRILEAELNARSASDRYHVVNAGIPGMRVGSGVSLLRELQERLQPRMVVIYPTPTHYIGVSRPYCGRPPRPVPAGEFRSPGVRIAEKVKDEVQRVLPLPVMTLLRKASIEWQTRDQDVLERIAPASIASFEADLHCAVRAVHGMGMIPMLVTHANRFGKVIRPDDAERLTQWRHQYPEMRESGFIELEEAANGVIRKVAMDEGAKLFDAAVALSGHSNWFADHAHFNNTGAAQLGALLAQAVLDTLNHP